MARRSNKTAHVLNLIAAGHDNQNDSAEETASADTPDNGAGKSESSVPPASKAAAAPVSTPNNISVIDTTSEDPVSDLIQQQLNDHFDEPAAEPVKEPAPMPNTETQSQAQPETLTQPQSETPTQTQPETQTQSQAQPETQTQSQAQPETQIQSQAQPETQMQTQSQAQPETQTQTQTAQVQPQPQVQPQSQTEAPAQTQPQAQTTAQTQPQTEPAPQIEQQEPEPVLAPDFVRLNVMESIVNDKIIYFMRQFDVCTCDRCIADTATLTLNGLLPKYIVTTPAAVDPLLSYYTNRLISDVTVEATKACMIVKDNPRH